MSIFGKIRRMLGSRSNKELLDLVWIRYSAKVNTGGYEDRNAEVGMWVKRKDWRDSYAELEQFFDEHVNKHTVVANDQRRFPIE